MTRRALFAAAAGAALAADRKNKAPISRDVPPVTFPEATPVKLSNGLTVLALEDRRLPLVYARFQVEGAGSLYEPQAGLADLAAAMLREGAGRRSAKQIGEDAATLGVNLGTTSTASGEVATLDGYGLAGRAAEWLELLADMLARPTFPADEFNGLRQRVTLGLRLRRGQPNVVADDALVALIYGAHPAGVSATPESVAALSADAIQNWHRERYAPGNTVLSVVGAIGASKLASRLEELLGNWKPAAPTVQLPPAPQQAAARRIRLIDRPGATQTELDFGGLLFDRRDADYFPMAVLNAVLGSGLGSRVYRRLRTEKSYAYNVRGTFGTFRYPGYWRLGAGVRTDVTGESLAIVLEELARLVNEPLPSEELEEAKRGLVGRFAMTLEDPQQVITYSTLRYRYGFSGDYWDRYPAKVAAVTAGEIQGVARKYLDPARVQMVAVGDAARIRPVLAKLGPVETA